jgi:hypothetical protein
MWFQDVQSGFPSGSEGVKVTSCLVLAEAVKQRGLDHRYAALRVGEFEVATSGGIWVAIRAGTGGTKCCQNVWAVPHRHLLLEWPPVWAARTCTANHDTAMPENGTFPVRNAGNWAARVVGHFNWGLHWLCRIFLQTTFQSTITLQDSSCKKENFYLKSMT